MKDTLILKDGTIMELETSASLSALRVSGASQAAMLEVWAKLTPENLKAVTIKNSAGLTVGNYTDLKLVSETSVVNADGSVLITYNIREKTDTEKEIEALTQGMAILAGEEA